MNTDLENIYEDMLTQFPKEELKTFEELKNLLAAPEYELHIFKPENISIGYSFWFKDEEMKFLWLDYIAIFKEFHSKGYGSVCIKDFIKQNPDMEYCFFEVEKPTNEQSVRRQKFYEKLGCKNTEIKYFFPNKYKELEMDLLYLGINTNTPPSSEYTNKAIAKVHKLLHNSEWKY